MPAIESLLAALAATADPEISTQEKTSGDANGFEQAMTDALAPDEKSTGEKPSPKLTLKPALVVSGKFTAAGKRAAVVENPLSSEPAISTGTEKKTVAAVKTDVADAPAAANNSNDINLSPAVCLPMVPTPAPLPPTGFWAGSPTVTTGGDQKIPATSPVTVNSLPAVEPPKGTKATTISSDARVQTTTPLPTMASATPIGTTEVKPIQSQSTDSPAEVVAKVVSGAPAPAQKLSIPGSTEKSATKILAESNLATTDAADLTMSEPVVFVNPSARNTEIISALEDTEPAVPTNMAPRTDFSQDLLPANANRPDSRLRGNFFAPASSREILGRDDAPVFSPSRAVLPEATVVLPENTTAVPTPTAIIAPETNPATVLTLPGTAKVLQVQSQPANAGGNSFSQTQTVPNPARTTLPESVSPIADATKAMQTVMPTAVLPESAPVQNEIFVNDSNSQPAPVTTNEKYGTRVASTTPAMKKSDKMEVLAGFAGQKLPDAGPVRLAPGLITRSQSELPPRISEKNAEQFSGEFIASFSNVPTGNTAATDNTNNSTLLPSLAETRVQTVERTHELVSQHALRLVESKADALSVVLRPDAGTELSLQLRQRDGVVEAQAVLSAGDYQLLNQNWPDLQSRLEQHGVKLAPLNGEMNFNAGANHQFSRQRSPQQDAETEQALAFAEFSVASGGATARSAGLRGWESWA